MFNNTIKKLLVGISALSILFAGVALVPTLAQAKMNNGLHLGEGVRAEFGGGLGLGLGNIIDMKGTTSASDNNSIKDIIKPAAQTFKQAVKNANTTFKTSQNNAKTQLKTSVTASTSQADRMAAVKTYFANVLAAFKVKATAIEAAFQAFIDTNFTANHAPVANAQS